MRYKSALSSSSSQLNVVQAKHLGYAVTSAMLYRVLLSPMAVLRSIFRFHLQFTTQLDLRAVLVALKTALANARVGGSFVCVLFIS